MTFYTKYPYIAHFPTSTWKCTSWKVLDMQNFSSFFLHFTKIRIIQKSYIKRLSIIFDTNVSFWYGMSIIFDTNSYNEGEERLLLVPERRLPSLYARRHAASQRAHRRLSRRQNNWVKSTIGGIQVFNKWHYCCYILCDGLQSSQWLYSVIGDAIFTLLVISELLYVCMYVCSWFLYSAAMRVNPIERLTSSSFCWWTSSSFCWWVVRVVCRQSLFKGW